MAIESYYTTLYLINYTESVNDQGRAIKTASAEVSFNGLINQASSTEVLTNKKLDIDADYKLFCDRHKQMGSPLNRSEMLAIICYTETECYSKMTKC